MSITISMDGTLKQSLQWRTVALQYENNESLRHVLAHYPSLCKIVNHVLFIRHNCLLKDISITKHKTNKRYTLMVRMGMKKTLFQTVRHFSYVFI